MKTTLYAVLGLAIACAGAVTYGQSPTQGPDSGTSGTGITLTNGGGNTISNPVPARVPLLPPPLTEMDLAASGVIRAVAATNTAPGAPEQYVVSTFKKEIRAVPGGAIADYGLLHVQFPLDAASPVLVTTPEGRSVSFRATLLAATDRITGDSYPLGAITNAIGEITGPSEVTYSQAFDALDADLVYRYEDNRLEQFVVLRQNFDLPAGVFAEDVNVECWTEFFNAPPTSTTTQAAMLRPATTTSPAVESTDLFADFGAVKLLPGGKAFSFGDEANTAPVGKTWADVPDITGASAHKSPRRFLIEMVDLQTIRPMLNSLPNPQKHASLGNPRHSRETLLASEIPRPNPTAQDSQLIAASTKPVGPKSGVVIDFALGTSVPVPPNIVSWWKAENNANDSISSLNGTLLNGAGYSASGRVGAAFSIGGGTQCVQVPNNTSLNFSSAMTLECWVYLNSYPNNDIVMIAGKDDSSVHQYQLTLCHYQNQRWCYQPLIVVPGGFAYFPGNIVAQTGTWTHLAMTYDGTSLRLYVNGVADGSIGATGAINTTTDPFRIGGYGTGPWTMNGRVDELSLYNRALSAGEIKSISDAGSAGKNNPGSCTPSSPDPVGWWPGDGNTVDLARGHSAIPMNGATYASGAVAQGFSFDGADDYSEIPSSTDLNPTTGLTVDAWVYQTGQMYHNMPIFSKDGEYNDRQYLLSIADSGKFRIHIGTDHFYYVDGSTSVALNTWYHVAMTYNGSSLKLFVNGSVDQSIPVSGSIIATSQPLRIGGSDPGIWGNYKFQGIIDEPTVYARALSSDDITQIYNSGIAGKCKADTDGDGLLDSLETLLGTSITSADTDGDGLSDRDEVLIYHTNPLVADPAVSSSGPTVLSCPP